MNAKNVLIAIAAIAIAGVLAGLGIASCRRQPRLAAPTHIARQGKFERPLLDHLARVSTNHMVNVVVVLSKQLGEHDKRVILQNINDTNRVQKMRLRRTALIKALQSLARQTQSPLRGYLRSLQTNGLVREIRPLWLSNAIGVRAPPPVLYALASSNEVASIHLDLPRPTKRGTVEIPPWGLEKIQVPDAHLPGSELDPSTLKQTVVVAVLDTGVDYEHPDLKNRMWVNHEEDILADGEMTNEDFNHKDEDLNGFIDDVIGWNFAGPGGNDPADVHGHGTHIAGTIAGDGAGGVRTGVAPLARIMALRESATRNTYSEEVECWMGMHYAANNGAHIINFSSGFIDGEVPPAYAQWRDQVQNITDCGVLFVGVADNVGNAFSPPSSVTTPGRVPVALTVGMSDRNDFIPYNSGEGPVTWEKVDPYFDYPYFFNYEDSIGLRKPDLVAPGKEIYSTQRGGDYTWMSGTSMAAPHVAGVAALLLGMHPDWGPYEVKYILEETADTVSQETSLSGWGRLNAARALEATIDPMPYDLAIDHVRVDQTPTVGKDTFFYAVVTNRAGQVVGNAEVRFYFADAPARTVQQLDPNMDGQPEELHFDYIGSYFIPVLGPHDSKHGSAVSVVRWSIGQPRANHWWLGAWVLPGASSDKEIQPLDNGAILMLPEAGNP